MNDLDILQDIDNAILLNGTPVTLNAKRAGKISSTITANTDISITNANRGDNFEIHCIMGGSGGYTITLPDIGIVNLSPIVGDETTLIVHYDGFNFTILVNTNNIVEYLEVITFSDFLSLYNSSTLVPGLKYNITDYQNVERIPNQTSGNLLNIDEATIPTESIVCTAISNNKIDNRCVSLTHEGEFVYINMDPNNLTENFYYENDHTSRNTQDDGAFFVGGVSYTITGADTVEIVTNGLLDYTKYLEFSFENYGTSYSYYVGDTLQTLIDNGDILVSPVALNTYEITFVGFAEDYFALRNSFDEYYDYFSAETVIVEIQGRVYGRTRPVDNVEIRGCDPRTRVVAIYEVNLSVINKAPQYCYLATGGISNAGFVFSLTGNVRYDFMFENISTFNESQNVHIGQSTNFETSFYIAGFNRIENLTMRDCGRSYFELAPRNSTINQIDSNICLGPWNSTDVTGYLNLVIFGDGVDNSNLEVIQFSFYEQYLSNANLQAQVITNHRIRSTAISPTNILDVQGGSVSNLFMDCGANIPQNLKIKAVSLNFLTINGICRDSEISGRTVNTNTFSTLSGSRIFAKNDILNNNIGSFLNNTFNVETFSNVTVAAMNENNITCKLFTAISGGGIIRNLVLYASGNFASRTVANTFDNATGVCSSITDLTTLNNTIGHKFLGGTYASLVLSSNIDVAFNGGASNATIAGNQTSVTYAKEISDCEVNGAIVNSHFLGGITNANLLFSNMNNTIVDQEIAFGSATTVNMNNLQILDGAATLTGSSLVEVGFGLVIYMNHIAATTLQISQTDTVDGCELTIKDISGNASTNNITLTGVGAGTITVDGVVNPVITTDYGEITMKRRGALRYTI